MRDKRSSKEAAELRTNWKRLRCVMDGKIRAELRGDPDVDPTDEAFWLGAKLVMLHSKKDANVEKALDTIEAQPRMQQVMSASAADIKAGRVLNTRELRRRHNQTKTSKDSCS